MSHRALRVLRGAPVIAVLAVLAVLAVVAAATPPAPARETIDIGVEDAAAPWSQADGTGYVNDLVRAAFGAVQIDVRLHVLPYARCKQQVVTGELVACVSMSPEPDLRGVVRFSARPLFEFTCTFFESTTRPIPRRLEDFPRGTRIGTVLGYEYPPDMLERVRRSGAVLEPAPTEETSLRKLAAGRVAAAVVNSDPVKSPHWVAANAGVTGRVRSVFSIGGMPAYIGFSLRHRRGRSLADRFDVGYARIVATGERDRIQRRWARRASARPGP